MFDKDQQDWLREEFQNISNNVAERISLIVEPMKKSIEKNESDLEVLKEKTRDATELAKNSSKKIDDHIDQHDKRRKIGVEIWLILGALAAGKILDFVQGLLNSSS